MHRIVFILMIALLPLRGWLGEAMATDMASINFIAAKESNTLSTGKKYQNMMLTDCHMQQNVSAHQSNNPSDDRSEETQSQTSCNSCQACHASGLVNSFHGIPSVATHSSVPLAHIARLTSASVALGQKPPIL